MGLLPNCEYCGKFLNPYSADVKVEPAFGFMGIDRDRVYHIKCRKKNSRAVKTEK
jgi:hypothetical protein